MSALRGGLVLLLNLGFERTHALLKRLHGSDECHEVRPYAVAGLSEHAAQDAAGDFEIGVEVARRIVDLPLPECLSSGVRSHAENEFIDQDPRGRREIASWSDAEGIRDLLVGHSVESHARTLSGGLARFAHLTGAAAASRALLFRHAINAIHIVGNGVSPTLEPSTECGPRRGSVPPLPNLFHQELATTSGLPERGAIEHVTNKSINLGQEETIVAVSDEHCGLEGRHQHSRRRAIGIRRFVRVPPPMRVHVIRCDQPTVSGIAVKAERLDQVNQALVQALLIVARNLAVGMSTLLLPTSLLRFNALPRDLCRLVGGPVRRDRDREGGYSCEKRNEQLREGLKRRGTRVLDLPKNAQQRSTNPARIVSDIAVHRRIVSGVTR